MSSDPFVEHVVELLAALGTISARRMFGGWGVYCDGLIVGLVAEGRLHLKVDEHNRPQFAAAGCTPFVYDGKGKPIAMSYWTVPDAALDAPAAMQPWGELALAAALRAAAAKAGSAPRQTYPGTRRNRK